MKQQAFIQIPEPCHENWDTMTPEGRGRFCASCAKTVVDFSTMSDAQVLNYLSGIKGNTCGRFRDDQLERAMEIEAGKKKTRWQWILATLAAFSLTNKLAAQSNKRDITPPPISEKKDTDVVITVGMILPRIVPEQKAQPITIKGIVRDITGMPLPDAVITIDGKTHISSDKDGRFSFQKPKGKKATAVISVTYIGYKTEMLTVNYEKSNVPVIVTLTRVEQMLGEVSVTSSFKTISCSRTTGLTAVVTSISTIDTIAANCKKVLGMANVYPNPSTKGSLVNIKLKEAGDYAFQLLSNAGTFVNQQTINSVLEKQTVPFTIPANIAAGNYYLRIINNTTKKQSTEKIVVM